MTKDQIRERMLDQASLLADAETSEFIELHADAIDALATKIHELDATADVGAEVDFALAAAMRLKAALHGVLLPGGEG